MLLGLMLALLVKTRLKSLFHAAFCGSVTLVKTSGELLGKLREKTRESQYLQYEIAMGIS